MLGKWIIDRSLKSMSLVIFHKYASKWQFSYFEEIHYFRIFLPYAKCLQPCNHIHITLRNAKIIFFPLVCGTSRRVCKLNKISKFSFINNNNGETPPCHLHTKKAKWQRWGFVTNGWLKGGKRERRNKRTESFNNIWMLHVTAKVEGRSRRHPAVCKKSIPTSQRVGTQKLVNRF